MYKTVLNVNMHLFSKKIDICLICETPIIENLYLHPDYLLIMKSSTNTVKSKSWWSNETI